MTSATTVLSPREDVFDFVCRLRPLIYAFAPLAIWYVFESHIALPVQRISQESTQFHRRSRERLDCGGDGDWDKTTERHNLILAKHVILTLATRETWFLTHASAGESSDGSIVHCALVRVTSLLLALNYAKDTSVSLQGSLDSPGRRISFQSLSGSLVQWLSFDSNSQGSTHIPKWSSEQRSSTSSGLSPSRHRYPTPTSLFNLELHLLLLTILCLLPGPNTPHTQSVRRFKYTTLTMPLLSNNSTHSLRTT